MNRVMLVLSAGASRRMGRPKALLIWKGKTLLEHAVERAQDAGFLPLVVLGDSANELRLAMSEDVARVVNSEWEQGIGGSISCGVRYALQELAPGLVGVSLVDQPLITSQHLRSLYEECTEAVDCVATGYPNSVGVPAVFGPLVFERLSKLSGEIGAKRLLDGSEFRVKHIAFSDTLDIDDPLIWEDFLEKHG